MEQKNSCQKIKNILNQIRCVTKPKLELVDGCSRGPRSKSLAARADELDALWGKLCIGVLIHKEHPNDPLSADAQSAVGTAARRHAR